MKNGLILSISLLFLLSCNTASLYETVYITTDPTVSAHTELFLSENGELNVFYDICAKDSFLFCLDFYNDTILKVYAHGDSPKQCGYLLKGPGPEELIFPFFSASVHAENDKVALLDINAWKIKEASLQLANGKHKLKMVKDRSLPAIPPVKEYHETDSCLYGVDVDRLQGSFFIWNKSREEVTVVNPLLEKNELPFEYSEDQQRLLRENHLAVNETHGSICIGMVNLNLLCLYDLKGNPIKRVVIGEKLLAPEPDPRYLDFPKANKYIVSMTGTAESLFCLCNAEVNSSQSSQILHFDWDGNLKEVIRLDACLEKISVTPNGDYLYGVRMTAEGGSDVVRITLGL